MRAESTGVGRAVCRNRLDASASVKRSGRRSRPGITIAMVLLALVTACASGHGPAAPAASSLAGRTLTYQFENGRTYRAAYGLDQVDFELIAPARPDAPAATFAYRAIALRDGLFLVVWMDPAYHTTFAIDLDARTLHASALRPREGAFLGTARILSVEHQEERTDDPSRSVTDR